MVKNYIESKSRIVFYDRRYILICATNTLKLKAELRFVQGLLLYHTNII
jgi:hypothetical protein